MSEREFVLSPGPNQLLFFSHTLKGPLTTALTPRVSRSPKGLLYQPSVLGRMHRTILETTLKTAFLFLATLICGVARLAAQTPKCPTAPSHIDVERGEFSTQPGVSFRLHHFVATLIPMGKTVPYCLQKMTVVSHAEIFISNESLTAVFAAKLDGSNSKIRDLTIENGLGKVKLSGKLTKMIPIAFTIEGPVRTDGTLLLLDATSIKADGIPVKALLDVLGEHLSSVFGLKDVRGVAVHDNTLAFAPEQIAHLKGHIASAEPTAEGLILRYSSPVRTATLPVSRPH